MPSPSEPLSPNLHMITNLEVLQILFFYVFMEASLHKHNWLNHSPLSTDLTSRPSPRPEGGEEGTVSFNPLIMWLVPLATNPQP